MDLYGYEADRRLCRLPDRLQAGAPRRVFVAVRRLGVTRLRVVSGRPVRVPSPQARPRNAFA